KARVDGFAIDVELLHLAERYRLSLKEVPVSVDESRRSTVRVTTDALGMVRDLFLIRSWAGQGAYDLPEDHPTLPGLEQARSQNEPVPSAIRD
ncbi:MAG: hypothetical protein ACR2M4_05070, partial [Actinomycetota bacterium]